MEQRLSVTCLGSLAGMAQRLVCTFSRKDVNRLDRNQAANARVIADAVQKQDAHCNRHLRGLEEATTVNIIMDMHSHTA